MACDSKLHPGFFSLNHIHKLKCGLGRDSVAKHFVRLGLNPAQRKEERIIILVYAGIGPQEENKLGVVAHDCNPS